VSQKIKNCLWFTSNAEDAVNYYTGIFPNSKIESKSTYKPNPKEDTEIVLTIEFTLNGMEFLALNGGKECLPSFANSLVIYCENPKEIDHYWDNLTKDGNEQPCGWLIDKYGYSWQVVPSKLAELMTITNKLKSQAVMNELMKMKKLEISILEKAYELA
jgi:predicted 3-demethylubiquinone-9 3-methyltransferase (glyoxalase superfamily)